MQTRKLALLSTMPVGFGGAVLAQQATDQIQQPVGGQNAAEIAQEAADTAQEAAEIAQEAADTAEQAADANAAGTGVVRPEDEGESGMASDTTDPATQPADAAQSGAEQATAEGDAESGMAGDTADPAMQATGMAQGDPDARTPSVGTAEQPYEGTIFGNLTVDAVLDMPVVDANGEDVGTLADLLIDQDGAIDRAIVEVGGFLGFGAKSVALDIDRLTVAEGDGEIVVDVTAQELETMPAWERDDSGWYSG
jgi:sporulation protein YlmC with PRC-barrel domain